MIPGFAMMLAPKVAGGGDPHWSNVVFLANWDTGVIDLAKGKTITVTGTPARNSVIPFDGGPSMRFDEAAPSSITLADSADWTFSGAFTVEGYVWIDASMAATLGVIFDFGGIAGSNWQSQSMYVLKSDNSTHWTVSSNAISGGDIVSDAAAGAIPFGTWCHYELSWDGTTYRQFINGSLVRSVSASSPPYNPSYGVMYGSHPNNTSSTWNSGIGTYMIKGALGPQRITKGVARHTSSFTPDYKRFPVG